MVRRSLVFVCLWSAEDAKDLMNDSHHLFVPDLGIEHDAIPTRRNGATLWLDLIFSDHFSPNERGVFEPLRDTLLTHGDHFMHLADLKSYLEADHRLIELYTDPEEWSRKAILNVAGSGKFSSDRTIAEYAREIWNVEPCPLT
jgi:glucan phosphorylase